MTDRLSQLYDLLTDLTFEEMTFAVNSFKEYWESYAESDPENVPEPTGLNFADALNGWALLQLEIAEDDEDKAA